MWLKGDLHLHSRHSKDSTNNPEAKIIHFAEKAGFDYLAITDHDNHVHGDVAHNTWSDPEFHSDKVLLLYGAEWTTDRGHGNVFSAKPYDHQRLYDVRDARDRQIMAVKKALGVHLSANHPANSDHFGFSFDLVDSIEVWNSTVWPKNRSAVLVWDDMLKSGRMITGRGGSDSHHGAPDTPAQTTPRSIEATANYVGTPTTWVFAAARTKQAVVDALTDGRVSVSANPDDPRVEFYADVDGDGRMDMMMGDDAKPSGKPVTFEIKLVGGGIRGAVYKVKVVKNGEDFRSLDTDPKTQMASFTDTPAPDARTYYRLEVEGPQTPYPEVPNSMALSGNMVGLSNPIYFNYDPAFRGSGTSVSGAK
ncbi:CehA/McbA family metallohydrolase [Stakelama saccharophila]|uniref:CehA/McbA family metallohydrolase n=1 Tax=Stakelama saccharophila TaxID=3075605 RepID=A0ABZ0B9R8_9SPHN|nr:CehA/McbA family metallohydrolase [Stakelama sp. W311]WNO53866.1 CehA/McbA family metallohydrolase [Stakelama sp. W311]